jgi:predicted transcriptional regulator
VVKTTIYLPEELKAAVERAATEEGRSEAAVIRAAIRSAVVGRAGRRPRVPLVARGLGDPTAAARVDELLRGFGQR